MAYPVKPLKVLRAIMIFGLVLLPSVPGVEIGIVATSLLALIAGGAYLFDAYRSEQEIQEAHETLEKLEEGELTLEQIQAGEDGLKVKDDDGNLTQIN
ncbi:hypothetical protein [Natrinema sp. HArc-T2]|uniref:hypothetical protein n=1 Tax=Natrinema sp. HArc-T2 TaxID=3242701 RepID=UPI00359E7713